MKLKQICSFLLVVSVLLSLCACSSSSLVCKHCGEGYEEGALFCPSCGEKIQSSTLCSKGHENEAGARFCSQCGEALGSSDLGGDNGGNGEGNNDNQSENSQADNAQNIWLMITSGATSDYACQYYYNFDGVLVAKRWYYTSTAKTTGIYEYAYDEHGNMILEALTYNPGGKTYSHTYKNQYDESERLISVTDAALNVTEYKYDEKGALTETITRDKDGVEEYREEYESGKKKRKYGNNGYEFEEQYFYDENGRLEKIVQTDIPMEGSDEQMKTTITYVYDGNGNAVSEKRVSAFGSVSETTYQYMSLADYRAQGLHLVLPTPDGDSGSGSSGDSHTGNSVNGVKCKWCEDTPGKIDCFACEGTGKVYGSTCKVPSCNRGKIKCPYCGGDTIIGN